MKFLTLLKNSTVMLHPTNIINNIYSLCFGSIHQVNVPHGITVSVTDTTYIPSAVMYATPNINEYSFWLDFTKTIPLTNIKQVFIKPFESIQLEADTDIENIINSSKFSKNKPLQSFLVINNQTNKLIDTNIYLLVTDTAKDIFYTTVDMKTIACEALRKVTQQPIFAETTKITNQTALITLKTRMQALK